MATNIVHYKKKLNQKVDVSRLFLTTKYVLLIVSFSFRNNAKTAIILDRNHHQL